MGGMNDPKAVVCYINPGENFEEIVPKLYWDTYLLFAVNYYLVDWGILINGLQLKVLSIGDPKKQSTHYWQDLDGIIQHERSDEFFTIFKFFSNLKASEGNGLLIENIRKSETDRVTNFSDRCNFQSIVELCKKKGDTVIVGFIGGEKALASRDIASLEKRMYKWDNTSGGNGIKDLSNWIRGSVFTSMIDEKYLQTK